MAAADMAAGGGGGRGAAEGSGGNGGGGGPMSRRDETWRRLYVETSLNTRLVLAARGFWTVLQAKRELEAEYNMIFGYEIICRTFETNGFRWGNAYLIGDMLGNKGMEEIYALVTRRSIEEIPPVVPYPEEFPRFRERAAEGLVEALEPPPLPLQLQPLIVQPPALQQAAVQPPGLDPRSVQPAVEPGAVAEEGGHNDLPAVPLANMGGNVADGEVAAGPPEVEATSSGVLLVSPSTAGSGGKGRGRGKGLSSATKREKQPNVEGKDAPKKRQRKPKDGEAVINVGVGQPLSTGPMDGGTLQVNRFQDMAAGPSNVSVNAQNGNPEMVNVPVFSVGENGRVEESAERHAEVALPSSNTLLELPKVGGGRGRGRGSGPGKILGTESSTEKSAAGKEAGDTPKKRQRKPKDGGKVADNKTEELARTEALNEATMQESQDMAAGPSTPAETRQTDDPEMAKEPIRSPEGRGGNLGVEEPAAQNAEVAVLDSIDLLESPEVGASGRGRGRGRGTGSLMKREKSKEGEDTPKKRQRKQKDGGKFAVLEANELLRSEPLNEENENRLQDTAAGPSTLIADTGNVNPNIAKEAVLSSEERGRSVGGKELAAGETAMAVPGAGDFLESPKVGDGRGRGRGRGSGIGSGTKREKSAKPKEGEDTPKKRPRKQKDGVKPADMEAGELLRTEPLSGGMVHEDRFQDMAARPSALGADTEYVNPNVANEPFFSLEERGRNTGGKEIATGEITVAGPDPNDLLESPNAGDGRGRGRGRGGGRGIGSGTKKEKSAKPKEGEDTIKKRERKQKDGVKSADMETGELLRGEPPNGGTVREDRVQETPAGASPVVAERQDSDSVMVQEPIRFPGGNGTGEETATGHAEVAVPAAGDILESPSVGGTGRGRGRGRGKGIGSGQYREKPAKVKEGGGTPKKPQKKTKDGGKVADMVVGQAFGTDGMARQEQSLSQTPVQFQSAHIYTHVLPAPTMETGRQNGEPAIAKEAAVTEHQNHDSSVTDGPALPFANVVGNTGDGNTVADHAEVVIVGSGLVLSTPASGIGGSGGQGKAVGNGTRKEKLTPKKGQKKPKNGEEKAGVGNVTVDAGAMEEQGIQETPLGSPNMETERPNNEEPATPSADGRGDGGAKPGTPDRPKGRSLPKSPPSKKSSLK